MENTPDWCGGARKYWTMSVQYVQMSTETLLNNHQPVVHWVESPIENANILHLNQGLVGAKYE